MRLRSLFYFAIVAIASLVVSPASAASPCPRPVSGAAVAAPPDLFSRNGALNVTFNYYTQLDGANRTLFCFVTDEGLQSPTLHLWPGDTLTITLNNKLPVVAGAAPEMAVAPDIWGCGSLDMTSASVNMHFHGTNTRPICHSDETIRTLVNAGDTFAYRVKIPFDEPPGLYWYHPHVHGLSDLALQGGATGAIVVEGIERLQPKVRGLPERVLLVRDQRIRVPAHFNPPGSSRPSWDVSLNYVPIEFPAYVPAQMKMTVGGKEFWRLANTSADTIVDLDLVYDGVAQPLEIVALDGVPVGSHDGTRRGKTFTVTHILVPPAGRAEFIVTAPSSSVKKAIFETREIDGGPAADNNLQRPLAALIAEVPRPVAALRAIPEPTEAPGPQRFEGLEDERVRMRRKLYFSEEDIFGKKPPLEFPVDFFITVEGQTPKLYSATDPPAIVTRQDSVEEWTIENRTEEVHEFHIHQIHFQLREINHVKVTREQRQFYDTFQVPYWSGSGPYPSITVAMDFRGNIAGDFLYHCHILGHEDGGMMAKIRVLPRREW